MKSAPTSASDHHKALCDNRSALTPVYLAIFTFAVMTFTTFLDPSRLHIALTDEVGYLTAGLEHMDRPDQWNIYSFPLHSLTYALTGLFETDPVRIYQLNAFIPFYVLALLFQLHVYRQTGSALLAVLLVAPLFLATDMGVSAWPRANQTACLIFLAGVLFLPHRPSLIRMACHLTLLYFLMGFARSEQILSLYMMCFIAVGWASLSYIKHRDWAAWKQKFIWPIILASSLSLCLSATLGKPVLLDKYRSYVAFYQHFSYSLWLRADDTIDPWTQGESIAESYFGDANSISGALSNNPLAFFNHTLANLQHFASWAVNKDPVGGLAWLFAFGVYSCCACRLWRKVVTQWRAGQEENLGLLRLIISVAPLPTLLMLAIIFPRTNYLQMGYILLLSASLLIHDTPNFITRLSGPIPNGIATVVAIGLLALLNPISIIEDPAVDVIDLLRADALRQDYDSLSLATTTSICVFTTQKCTQHIVPYSEEQFKMILESTPVDYVVAYKHPGRPASRTELTNYFSELSKGGTSEEWIVLQAPNDWNVLRRNR